METVKIDISAELYRNIDELAKQRGMSARGIIERAAKVFLSKPANKNAVALNDHNADALRVIAREMHTTRTNAAQDIFSFGIQEYQRVTSSK